MRSAALAGVHAGVHVQVFTVQQCRFFAYLTFWGFTLQLLQMVVAFLADLQPKVRLLLAAISGRVP